MPDLGLNRFTKKYIKNILARVTGYIEESTGVASNYCNYMNTQTKNPFEIEHIITDHYEWFTDEERRICRERLEQFGYMAK